MGQKYRAEPVIGRRQRFILLGPDDETSGQEWVQIGRLAEIGPPRGVRLDLTREHVLAIVGKRGSGKSFTLGAFLEGLCTKDGSTVINQISKKRAGLLFDTLNIFQWMIAPVQADATSRHVEAQAKLLREWGLEPVDLDVDLWIPAGFEDRSIGRAQAFRIRTAEMEASDWAALLGVDTVQDVMGQLLSQVVDKVTRRGWSTKDGSSVRPKSEYELTDLLDCLSQDHEIADDYARETVRAMRQRLSAYEASPLFGSTGTSLGDLLKGGRLSVLLLSGIPDDIRLVIIFLTIRKLLFARAKASEASKSLELGFVNDPQEQARLQQVIRTSPPKAWVLVDEAQNVFPSGRHTAASEILLRFVREGRNFGLSLGFTTQQPSAIDARIMAQVDTVITHTLTVQRDLENVLANLKSRAPAHVELRGVHISLSDAIRHLEVGQAFVSSTDADRGLFMDVRPRTSIHGGFEG